MKKLLLSILLLASVGAQAQVATVYMAITNWDATLATNQVKVFKIDPKLTIYGGVGQIGVAKWLTPTNGVCTNSMLPGTYAASIYGTPYSNLCFIVTTNGGAQNALGVGNFISGGNFYNFYNQALGGSSSGGSGGNASFATNANFATNSLNSTNALYATRANMISQPAVTLVGLDSNEDFTITSLTPTMLGAQAASTTLSNLTAGLPNNYLGSFTGNAANLTNFPSYLNVNDFGADPTGVADSSAAFVAALNYAVFTNGAPKEVRAPGKYKLLSTVVLPPTANGMNAGGWVMTNGYSLIGQGSGRSYIDASAITGNAFEFVAGNTLTGQRLNNFTMKGFTIRGPEFPTFNGTSQGAAVFMGQPQWRTSAADGGGWRNRLEDLDVAGFRDLVCITNMITTVMYNVRAWSNYTRGAFFIDRSDTTSLDYCTGGYNWRESGNPDTYQQNEWGALVAVGGGAGVYVNGGDGWNWSRRAFYVDATPLYVKNINIEGHWGPEMVYINAGGFFQSPVEFFNCKFLATANQVVVGGITYNNANYTRSIFHGVDGGTAWLKIDHCDWSGGPGVFPWRAEAGANVTVLQPPTITGRPFTGKKRTGDVNALWNNTTRLQVPNDVRYWDNGIRFLDQGAGWITGNTHPYSRITMDGGQVSEYYVGSVDSIAAGGTGYTVGDKLYLDTGASGYCAVPAYATVNTVSGGVVTAVTLTANGDYYSAQPPTPNTVTGGTGNGCILNITASSNGSMTKPLICMPVGQDIRFASWIGSATLPGGVDSGNNVTMQLGFNPGITAPASPQLSMRMNAADNSVRFGFGTTDPKTFMDVNGRTTTAGMTSTAVNTNTADAWFGQTPSNVLSSAGSSINGAYFTNGIMTLTSMLVSGTLVRGVDVAFPNNGMIRSGTSDGRVGIGGTQSAPGLEGWFVMTKNEGAHLIPTGDGAKDVGGITNRVRNAYVNSVVVAGASGELWTSGQATELLTLSTSGTTTDTTASLLPANSIIEAVAIRVTTTITTATAFTVGDATIANRFLATGTALTANTTAVGLKHADQTGTSGPIQSAAAKVRVTTTGTPGAGVIRITVFYRTFTPPTS